MEKPRRVRGEGRREGESEREREREGEWGREKEREWERGRGREKVPYTSASPPPREILFSHSILFLAS